MNDILNVYHLSKCYNTPQGEIEAIKDISFNVQKGDFVGIVGSSGCGKSTLLNILSNLEDKTSGTITINGEWAYMLQNDALLPWLSVLDNALLGLDLTHKKTKENILYVKDLITKFGLENFINEKPDNLSGGMKQRVALIRTLALKPDIIFLDEPLSALDYMTRLMITDEIYSSLKELGITVILISHDIAECVSFCDKIIVLSKRPSFVKKKYEIKLNTKGIPSINRKDELFNYYYDLVWSDLDKDVD